MQRPPAAGGGDCAGDAAHVAEVMDELHVFDAARLTAGLRPFLAEGEGVNTKSPALLLAIYEVLLFPAHWKSPALRECFLRILNGLVASRRMVRVQAAVPGLIACLFSQDAGAASWARLSLLRDSLEPLVAFDEGAIDLAAVLDDAHGATLETNGSDIIFFQNLTLVLPLLPRKLHPGHVDAIWRALRRGLACKGALAFVLPAFLVTVGRHPPSTAGELALFVEAIGAIESLGEALLKYVDPLSDDLAFAKGIASLCTTFASFSSLDRLLQMVILHCIGAKGAISFGERERLALFAVNILTIDDRMLKSFLMGHAQTAFRVVALIIERLNEHPFEKIQKRAVTLTWTSICHSMKQGLVSTIGGFVRLLVTALRGEAKVSDECFVHLVSLMQPSSGEDLVNILKEASPLCQCICERAARPSSASTSARTALSPSLLLALGPKCSRFLLLIFAFGYEDKMQAGFGELFRSAPTEFISSFSATAHYLATHPRAPEHLYSSLERIFAATLGDFATFSDIARLSLAETLPAHREPHYPLTVFHLSIHLALSIVSGLSPSAGVDRHAMRQVVDRLWFSQKVHDSLAKDGRPVSLKAVFALPDPKAISAAVHLTAMHWASDPEPDGDAIGAMLALLVGLAAAAKTRIRTAPQQMVSILYGSVLFTPPTIAVLNMRIDEYEGRVGSSFCRPHQQLAPLKPLTPAKLCNATRVGEESPATLPAISLQTSQASKLPKAGDFIVGQAKRAQSITSGPSQGRDAQQTAVEDQFVARLLEKEREDERTRQALLERSIIRLQASEVIKQPTTRLGQIKSDLCREFVASTSERLTIAKKRFAPSVQAAGHASSAARRRTLHDETESEPDETSFSYGALRGDFIAAASSKAHRERHRST